MDVDGADLIGPCRSLSVTRLGGSPGGPPDLRQRGDCGERVQDGQRRRRPPALAIGDQPQQKALVRFVPHALRVDEGAEHFGGEDLDVQWIPHAHDRAKTHR